MRIALVSGRRDGTLAGGATRYVARLADLLASDNEVTVRTPGQLRDTAPDVVHIQHELLLYGAAASAFSFPVWASAVAKRYPAAVTVHGVLDPFEIPQGLFQGRVPALAYPVVPSALRWIFRSIARLPAVKIVHGAALADRLVRYGARREEVVVAPMLSNLRARSVPRDAARSHLGIPPDAQVVLSWGFLNGYKGFECVLEGFERFAQKAPGALLLMNVAPHPKAAGSRIHDAEMTRLAERAKCVPGVRFGGFISDAELPYYICAADVGVFAYSLQIAESGPLTDTVRLGTPVLLSGAFLDTPRALSFPPTEQGVCDALSRFFARPRAVAEASALLASTRTDDKALAANCTAYERAIARFRRA